MSEFKDYLSRKLVQEINAIALETDTKFEDMVLHLLKVGINKIAEDMPLRKFSTRTDVKRHIKVNSSVKLNEAIRCQFSPEDDYDHTDAERLLSCAFSDDARTFVGNFLMDNAGHYEYLMNLNEKLGNCIDSLTLEVTFSPYEIDYEYNPEHDQDEDEYSQE